MKPVPLKQYSRVASVAVAARGPRRTDGWWIVRSPPTKTFTDPRFCTAIVDRLTFGGNIIGTGSDSCRLARTEARQRATADF
ncbi:hypothetical protein [Streptomyces sp. NPDC101776]|uniref:hypothetical protein n=1 Tax=Streptomyces sp. NPDC101776 TaxID=3366146 RepID=UPI00380CAA31